MDNVLSPTICEIWNLSKIFRIYDHVINMNTWQAYRNNLVARDYVQDFISHPLLVKISLYLRT